MTDVSALPTSRCITPITGEIGSCRHTCYAAQMSGLAHPNTDAIASNATLCDLAHRCRTVRRAADQGALRGPRASTPRSRNSFWVTICRRRLEASGKLSRSCMSVFSKARNARLSWGFSGAVEGRPRAVRISRRCSAPRMNAAKITSRMALATATPNMNGSIWTDLDRKLHEPQQLLCHVQD